uniref:Uncharacterized protein n=1 Tax=Ditylenchus dipsaci TaxID=166011 RepID=A0A915CT75_9BILA
MFIIFGFIIVGLSLVSMCINVIQLKLEELFEELLLTMMEEYDTQGQAGLAAPHIKPKMGMVDMWKMWKRRRRRARPQPTDLVTNTEDGLASSEMNLWKIFPFAKRRREVLLKTFHNKLYQLSKSTQTDFCFYEMHLLNQTVEVEEECLSDSEPTTMDTSTQSMPTTSSTNSNSSSAKTHVTITSSSNSSPIFGSSSSSSSYARSRLNPLCSKYCSWWFRHLYTHNVAGAMQQYAGNRRWTFFEIGKTPRGAPRGLVAPYMYTKRTAKTVSSFIYLYRNVITYASSLTHATEVINLLGNKTIIASL